MNAKKIFTPKIYLPIIGSMILFAPLLIYALRFRSFKISDDPSTWGVFGDYVGGVLNPLISAANLIILGYLTYLVSQQTNKENKSLFILQKRMAAYEELTMHFYKVNMMEDEIERTTSYTTFLQRLPGDVLLQHLPPAVKDILSVTLAYTNFYHTLFTFKIRYSHLFKYDFASKDFRLMISEVKKLSEKYDQIAKIVVDGKPHNLTGNDFKPTQEYIDAAMKVINSLRSEIEVTE